MTESCKLVERMVRLAGELDGDMVDRDPRGLLLRLGGMMESAGALCDFVEESLPEGDGGGS